MTKLPGHSCDYGPKIAAEIWTGPNNAVGNGVESREAGASPRSDTRGAESMEGFRMLLQSIRLKSDRLLVAALQPSRARAIRGTDFTSPYQDAEKHHP